MSVGVGSEGIEPTPCGLKVRCAACYTTTPFLVGCLRFKRRACIVVVLLFEFRSVVVLGIELSTTRLSAEYGRPALDYHSSRALRSRTETLLLPKQACYHLHLYPNQVRTAGFEPAIFWPPARRDNQASPRSDRVVLSSSPCGSRTQPARLERPMTSPEVERALLCAYAEREVGREALESSSAVLQTAADQRKRRCPRFKSCRSD